MAEYFDGETLGSGDKISIETESNGTYQATVAGEGMHSGERKLKNGDEFIGDIKNKRPPACNDTSVVGSLMDYNTMDKHKVIKITKED